MTAIETKNLVKRFGSQRVLDNLNLRVDEGEVYGLLGPNGAGKSTLLHLLLGFLRPQKGEIRVLGSRPALVQGRIGYLPERVRYHSHFTAREYLQAAGTFSNLKGEHLADRRRAVLELVGLAPEADRRLGTFSKGMLQRLGIAQALIHDPDLLLIDEPTSGLDPAGQREMIDLLTELRRQGHTVLMCTHQLPEVEALCDRVGILRNCRLAAEARVADLVSSRGVVITGKPPQLPEALTEALRSLPASLQIDGRQIRVGGDETLQQTVLRAFLDAGVSIAEVKPVGGGVEELYLDVMAGRPFAGSPPTEEMENSLNVERTRP